MCSRLHCVSKLDTARRKVHQMWSGHKKKLTIYSQWTIFSTQNFLFVSVIKQNTVHVVYVFMGGSLTYFLIGYSQVMSNLLLPALGQPARWQHFNQFQGQKVKKEVFQGKINTLNGNQCCPVSVTELHFNQLTPMGEMWRSLASLYSYRSACCHIHQYGHILIVLI